MSTSVIYSIWIKDRRYNCKKDYVLSSNALKQSHHYLLTKTINNDVSNLFLFKFTYLQAYKLLFSTTCEVQLSKPWKKKEKLKSSPTAKTVNREHQQLPLLALSLLVQEFKPIILTVKMPNALIKISTHMHMLWWGFISVYVSFCIMTNVLK